MPGAECTKTDDSECRDATHPNGICWTATCFFGASYTTVVDDCRGPDFTFCPITCDKFVESANIGTTCTKESDCKGGTTCKSSCDILYATLGAFCFDDNSCQY